MRLGGEHWRNRFDCLMHDLRGRMFIFRQNSHFFYFFTVTLTSSMHSYCWLTMDNGQYLAHLAVGVAHEAEMYRDRGWRSNW